jgi:hypothetical protein
MDGEPKTGSAKAASAPKRRGRAASSLPAISEAAPAAQNPGPSRAAPSHREKRGAQQPAGPKTPKPKASSASRGAPAAGEPPAAPQDAENALVVAEAAMSATEKVPIEELALRFNCSVQVLQLLGLIREGSRRRRESSVQRLVFPMRPCAG